MKKSAFLIVFILSIFLNNGATAQDANTHHNVHQGQTNHTTSHNSHKIYQHHIAAFTGLTCNFTHDKTLYTLGLDYEYRLKNMGNRWGIGLNAEYLFGDHAEYLLGIPVFFHIIKGLKFDVAPMYAIVEGFSTEHLAENLHKSHDAEPAEILHEFGFRVGFIYDIHIKRFSISPTVNLDNIGHSWALAFGVAFGFGCREIQ